MPNERISRRQTIEPQAEINEQLEQEKLALITQTMLNGIAPVTRDTRRKLSGYLRS